MLQSKFLHHVFFWLKEEGNKDHRNQLIQGLKKLSAVPTIRECHIGQPANTNREVIERGYTISWLVLFDNDTDQASYQDDPIHLQFVAECAHLWSKVKVFDSVQAG